jgi:L-ascorbate metabolism protein UlaG (beta-lactamase superfamily)
MTHALQLTYIGHATTLIELDGVRLLTDPLLRQRVWHLRRQKTTIQPDWVQNLDAVLISHLHWDHLDLPSLKRLDRNTQLIVPRGMARLLRRNGFQHLQELSIGQTTSVGPLTITATYADHDCTRLRFGRAADCLGYLIDGSHTIYFAGDTDLFPEMAGLADNLDLALLPVWGWGPTLGPGHMTPYRAAQALQLLIPRLAIPIHWGTLHPIGLNWFQPRFLSDPPQRFANFAATLAPQVQVHILPPGDFIHQQKPNGPRTTATISRPQSVAPSRSVTGVLPVMDP